MVLQTSLLNQQGHIFEIKYIVYEQNTASPLIFVSTRHLQKAGLGELQACHRSRQSWEAGKPLPLLVRQRFSTYLWKIPCTSVSDCFAMAEWKKGNLTKSAACHVTYSPAFSVKHTKHTAS